jgi:hypothetical protein
MNSQTQGTNGNAEPRYVCTNWDKPINVKVKSKGRGRFPARKVITEGITVLDVGIECADVCNLLNQGQEVRLRFKGRIFPAIRLFPLVDTDLTVSVWAATMGTFRKDTFAGKKVELRKDGKSLSREKLSDFATEKLAEIPSRRQDVESVTPDTMVECPKCGYSFRVGRRNSDK